MYVDTFISIRIYQNLVNNTHIINNIDREKVTDYWNPRKFTEPETK